MTTYGEIRTDILRTLDYPPEEVSGDIPLLVLSKMRDVSREVLSQYKGKELLKRSDVFVVDDTTTTVPVGAGGFEVTDMVFPYGISIDDGTTIEDDYAERFLGYISFEAWTGLNTYRLGNQRPERCFTINLDDRIVFSLKPTSGETWDTRLWYYKEVGAIDLGAAPELPQYFHSIITLGVVLEFPQLFKGGERLLLYRRLEQRYNELRRELFSSKGTGKNFMDKKFRKRGAGTGFFWSNKGLTL
jgi:hypothetical protein